MMVDPADGKSIGRTFHVITKDDDEKFRKRTYNFDGTLVRLAGTEELAADPSATVTEVKPNGLDTNKMGAKAHLSWFRQEWTALTGRLSKH